MFRSLFNRMTSKSSTARTPSATRASARPSLENLEQRSLLSATSLLGTGLDGTESLSLNFTQPAEVRVIETPTGDGRLDAIAIKEVDPRPADLTEGERDDPFFREGEYMWTPAGQLAGE